jgi:coenzyme F420-reducing hydrogenase gamma subunit
VSNPKVAIYKMSSCAGCQLEFLNLEPVLLDVLGLVDLSYFVMARREHEIGPYDVGFIEGAITCAEEIEKLKKARGECKTLVALGSCAAFGGIPSMKNWVAERVVEERVYPNVSLLSSVKAQSVGEYVKVDAVLKGCPVNRDELVEFVKGALMGMKPYLRPHSVCMECKVNENSCLALNNKEPCMGPVTSAGCKALCPGLGRTCNGCRGPANDANSPSLAKTFSEMGLHARDVVRKFRKFAGMTEEFEKGVPTS